MRILQLISCSQLRGAEVFAAQLSDELVDCGHEVVLAHLWGDASALPTSAGILRVGLGAKSTGVLNFGSQRALVRLVAGFRPDVIQANGSETLKYAALLRILQRSPPIVYRSISVASMWSHPGLKRQMVALALHRMDHIATVSAVGRADLIQNFGVRAERVSVLYRGVPFTAERSREERRVIRDRLRQNFSMPTDCRVVAHVGSFTPEKNHADLLRSFGELLSSNVNAVLLLVGDGPLRGEIERQIERTLPSGRVIVAGYRRDATELLEAVDVLALPSVAEGLPGVILEAAMAGVPAVAYDVGGVAEAITDRSSGILVRPGDVSGFTQALLTVLGDAEMRERMGQHARRRAVEDFDCSRSADRFVSLYGAVIRTQSGGEPPGGA